MDIDDLKQPEYTGENRCLPCTLVNLAIAAVAGWLVARKHRAAGVLAIAVSTAIIYFRGYLVPGTPTLTKRYLPADVLRLFGKEQDPEIAGGFQGVDAGTVSSGADIDSMTDEQIGIDTTDAHAGVDTTDPDDATAYFDPMVEPPGPDATVQSEPPAHYVDGDGDGDGDGNGNGGSDSGAINLETYFLEHEVIEPCEDIDDLCLTAEFERVWFDEIDAVDVESIELVDAVDAFGFEADPDELDLEPRGDGLILRANRQAVGRWPSRTALLADVAASRTLAEWMPDWDTHDPQLKGEICNALRIFLEKCPTGGDVHMTEEVVESCCTSRDVIAVICEKSGDRLFEHRLDAVEA
ncbi:hypothetical protein [Natrialba chahannaoensis]|nr:hypothetical protein [Natrialba chahannaoensis]